MYGMLLESIAHFVSEEYGEEAWFQVLDRTEYGRQLVIRTHGIYSGTIMTQLADALVAVVGGGTKTQVDFLNFFGICFVKFFTQLGYHKIMRVSGRHYRDFLHGIDNLHEQMRFTFPKMSSPFFFVTEEDRDGAVLHYRSHRFGFSPYVIGQLTEIGKTFYNIDVAVRVTQTLSTEKESHIVFRIDFNNAAYVDELLTKKNISALDLPPISTETMLKPFPFAFIFDSSMNVRLLGRRLMQAFREWGHTSLIGTDVRKLFRLRRPRTEFTWDNIIHFQRVVFEIETTTDDNGDSIRHRSSSGNNTPRERFASSEKYIHLRGQMKHIETWNCVAFFGSPILCNLEELESQGLFLNDLHMYDGSQDTVLRGSHHSAKLEAFIEKEAQYSEQLEQTLKTLEEWRAKGDNLVHSMLPPHVAAKMRMGHDTMDLCEQHGDACVLFAYLKGFDVIAENLTPQQSVSLINEVFSEFDKVLDGCSSIYKVETIGESQYMVASGITDTHVDPTNSVATFAIALLNGFITAHARLLPDDGDSVANVQIGADSGPVVSGVIGRKVPRYCLFGNCVNTASRMSSFGEKGKIHTSASFHSKLNHDRFVTQPRGQIQIKGKGAMETFWLLSKKLV